MKCENCNKEHDGSYGSGRFCSSRCARSFSTKNDGQELKEAICPNCACKHLISKRASNKTTLCIKCRLERAKCCYCGRLARYTLSNGRRCCSKTFQSCPVIRYKNAEGVVQAHKEGRCSTRHLDYTKIWNKGTEKYKHDLIFVKSDKQITSKWVIRKYLLKERSVCCEKCGRTKWNGKIITIEMHHIDGNKLNNKKSNLLLLCPNCHAQTSTWRNKNNGGVAKR